jgi:hypothetical protein
MRAGKEGKMTPEPRCESPADGREGPVKAGTPLHRLLQLIAEEVARALQRQPPPRGTPHLKQQERS